MCWNYQIFPSILTCVSKYLVPGFQKLAKPKQILKKQRMKRKKKKATTVKNEKEKGKQEGGRGEKSKLYIFLIRYCTILELSCMYRYIENHIYVAKR